METIDTISEPRICAISSPSGPLENRHTNLLRIHDVEKVEGFGLTDDRDNGRPE
jgi:hypothetical protein